MISSPHEDMSVWQRSVRKAKLMSMAGKPVIQCSLDNLAECHSTSFCDYAEFDVRVLGYGDLHKRLSAPPRICVALAG